MRLQRLKLLCGFGLFSRGIHGAQFSLFLKFLQVDVVGGRRTRSDHQAGLKNQLFGSVFVLGLEVDVIFPARYAGHGVVPLGVRRGLRRLVRFQVGEV